MALVSPLLSCLLFTSWLCSGSLLQSRLPGTSRSWVQEGTMCTLPCQCRCCPLNFLLGKHFLFALWVIAAITFSRYFEELRSLTGQCALCLVNVVGVLLIFLLGMHFFVVLLVIAAVTFTRHFELRSLKGQCALGLVNVVAVPLFSSWHALLGCALDQCCSQVSPAIQGAEVLEGTMCPLPCQCRCCLPYFPSWYALLGCALGHCCSHVSPAL